MKIVGQMVLDLLYRTLHVTTSPRILFLPFLSYLHVPASIQELWRSHRAWQVITEVPYQGKVITWFLWDEGDSALPWAHQKKDKTRGPESVWL